MSPAIFFDMDDTLVDTRAASWKLFAQTNSKHGPGAQVIWAPRRVTRRPA